MTKEDKLNIKKAAPPPIIIEGIKNFNDFHEKLSSMTSGFQIKIINKENTKINVQEAECYRNLTKMLTENGISWYSFEDKQNRPIKVIAKRLHHSWEPEKIVNELRKRGYKILEAVNKLKWKTKQPLNMFMLVFRKDENVRKIYGITDIMGMRVEIEPIKKSKLVPQCKNCQSYGHTQKYCARESRCVKCIGKHHTRDCVKPRDAPPKCVHCGENHPANFRGCSVAKEIQNIRNQSIMKKNLPGKPQRVSDQPNNPPSDSQTRINEIQKPTNDSAQGTYSQVAAKNIKLNQKPSYSPNTIEQTLQVILNKLDIQEKRLLKIDERINKLETRATGAIPKLRNGK